MSMSLSSQGILGLHKAFRSKTIAFAIALIMSQHAASISFAQEASSVAGRSAISDDPPCSGMCLFPIEAVALASQVAPKGSLAGRFALFVKAAGESGGRFFLNSEEDYRDRNCLTVALAPDIAAKLTDGTDLAAVKTRFVGKWLVIDGIAKRIRINLLEDGKPTGKYYYQIHIVVVDPHQIKEHQ